MLTVLMTGFLLDKKIGVNQPKRIENAKILIANTPMDTDKIKVRGVQYLYEHTLQAGSFSLYYIHLGGNPGRLGIKM